MRDIRKEKIESLITTLTSKFLLEQKIIGSIVTVMRVELNDSGSVATAWLSVLPDTNKNLALDELEKSRYKLNREIHDYMKSKFIPEVRFALDRGEEFRDKMDQLLKV